MEISTGKTEANDDDVRFFHIFPMVIFDGLIFYFKIEDCMRQCIIRVFFGIH